MHEPREPKELLILERKQVFAVCLAHPMAAAALCGQAGKEPLLRARQLAQGRHNPRREARLNTCKDEIFLAAFRMSMHAKNLFNVMILLPVSYAYQCHAALDFQCTGDDTVNHLAPAVDLSHGILIVLGP